MGRTYQLTTKILGHIRNRVKKDEDVLCRRCGGTLVIGDWVHSKIKQARIDPTQRSTVCYKNNKRPPSMPPKVYHLECAMEVHLV